jgi:general secretion pathway protein A
MGFNHVSDLHHLGAARIVFYPEEPEDDAMFLEHYNLLEQPFGVTPDTRFLYLNHMYREALASLWYGIEERRGFMALVAEPGMGKTTLLFQLLQRLRRTSARTVFLFQTTCNSHDLIRYLLLDLGIVPAPDMASMHHQLNEALLSEARAGRQFIFVIDEAQNLSESVLESIRLLSNFETCQGKLVQIILAGQPQLTTVLSSPGMQQLKQRISTLSRLEPLNTCEVAAYVRHRLQVAGHPDGSLFTRHAAELIANESYGIPRNINNLCFGALTVGFALGKNTIGCEIVEEVVADQKFSWLRAKASAPQNEASQLAEPVLQSVTGDGPKTRTRRTTQVALPRYATFAVSIAVLVGLLLTAVSADGARPETYLQFSSRIQSSAPSQTVGARVSVDTEQTGNGNRVVAQTPPPAFGPLTGEGIVAVAPQQDLRQICLHYLGYYDLELIENIQKLNPLLVDPNRILVGQRLRMPMEKIRTRRVPLQESGSDDALKIASGNQHE